MTIISGFFYGLGQAAMFVIIALVFHISTYFIVKNGVQIQNSFTVIFALFLASMSMGNISNILPNIGSCMKSAREILRIIDTKDE